MELQYPSQRQNGLDLQLKPIDKRYGSILFNDPISNSSSKDLPSYLKKSIIELITKDQQYKLFSIMTQEIVKLTDELSKQGLGWNLLHFIAKHNAHACLQLCLRACYQDDPKSYQKTVDSRTIDGDTALIIAFQNKSNLVIRVFLEYGGLDIYAMNNKKMTAYQIALNNENEEGLQLLMKYELKIKEKEFINLSVLNSPLEIKEERRCDSLIKCLLDCFSFKKQQTNFQVKPSLEPETHRKMIIKAPSQNSRNVLEVVWKQAITASGCLLPLFTQQIFPFSIKQNSIIVTNLLVFFQCLAQYTQILRNIIFKIDQKYYVKFYNGKGTKIIWIDNLFPYLSHNEEPLFLSLTDQIWPMVLQKALSQYYGGYFEPGKVRFEKLLEVVTGNFAYNIEIPELKDDASLIKLLNQLENENCIFVLKPRVTSSIKCPEGRRQCFAVLKIMNDKILVNCPFVTDQEKMRQTHESIEMKIQKSHYNNPHTMSIWISESQINTIFEEVIFCHTTLSHQTKPHVFEPFLTDKRFYLKIKMKKFYQGSYIFFQMKNYEQESMIATKVSGWASKGKSKKVIQKINYTQLGRICLKCEEDCDEYLIDFFFPVPNESANQKIQVKYQTENKIQIEVLDGIIGDLQYIEGCKNYFNAYHSRYEVPIIEEIGNYVLVMAATRNPCYIVSQTVIGQDKVVEGILTEKNTKLQMFGFENISFAVMSNTSEQEISKMKVISLEEVEISDENENDHK